MIDLDTILGLRLKTSVRFNSLFIPAKSIDNHIKSFSEPAIFHSDLAEPYTISKSGSLTKIRIGARYFALTTFHQLTVPGYNYEQLCLYNYEEKCYLTSNNVIFPNGPSEQRDDFDCLLFEFTEAVEVHGLPPIGWYDISSDLLHTQTPSPIMVCCVGYPGFRNNIDYDGLHYGASPNAIWGEAIIPGIKGRLSFRPRDSLTFDPDGMSGSPVFGISQENDELVANLSGILTNASRNCLNFLSLQRIKGFIASIR